MTFDSLICQRISLYMTTQNYFEVEIKRKTYTFYKQRRNNVLPCLYKTWSKNYSYSGGQKSEASQYAFVFY